MNEMTDTNKWNIHWLIEEPLLSSVLTFNATLVAKLGSEIDFGADHRPHITLAMGDLVVASGERLRDAVLSLAKELRPLPVEFGEVYVDDRGHYVFIDPRDQAPLTRTKEIAAIHTQGLIESSKFGGADNPAHLTLGYCAAPVHMLPDSTHHFKMPSVTLRRIGASPCGAHGTCLTESIVSRVGE